MSCKPRSCTCLSLSFLNKPQKPQTGFAPLLRQRHDLHVPSSWLSCKSQTQPRQAPVSSTFKGSPREENSAFEDFSPITAAQTRAGFSTGCRRQLEAPAASPKSHGNALPTAKPHSSRGIFLSFRYRVEYLNKQKSYICLFHMKRNKKPQYFACWVVKTQESCSGFCSLGVTPNIPPRVKIPELGAAPKCSVCSFSKNKGI